MIGSPGSVRRQLQELVDRTGVDELMVMTMMHSHADRVRSYELMMSELRAHPLERAATVGAR
ncbi:unannotated protein [freshwater metagenome]|uniref:Unannotated protein n=1 Tax=freshwater metagenome TaxID=449393 RepID=A0A6J6XNS6_9ZZZZ